MTDLINTPENFKAYIQKRNRIAWMLTGLMTLSYAVFILLIVFAPTIINRPISSDMPIPIGIPIGVGMIAFFFVVGCLYISIASRKLDPMIRSEETNND